jgi:hypothetical protein
MANDYRKLTDLELDALKRFAAWSTKRETPKGRKKPKRAWFDVLAMDYWYNARVWSGELGNDRAVGSILHSIRNSMGPDWLYSHGRYLADGQM